jgi:hypothetical protein
LDHTLRYLFSKKDAKSLLIQWILLLQEFNIEIWDKKGSENVVADHLSRLIMDITEDATPISETFLDEQLMHIAHNPTPWFADIVNYLACGGHFSANKTTVKILQCGFYGPTMFRDAHAYCTSCEHCQKLKSISKKNMMPLNPILIVEIFDVWGIDFMGPFLNSFGYCAP